MIVAHTSQNLPYVLPLLLLFPMECRMGYAMPLHAADINKYIVVSIRIGKLFVLVLTFDVQIFLLTKKPGNILKSFLLSCKQMVVGKLFFNRIKFLT